MEQEKYQPKRMFLILITVYLSIVLMFNLQNTIYAEETEPYLGVPVFTIELSNLDESGELIYAGIDVAVFEDPDADGTYTVKAGKVQRFITNHKNITVDLGSPADFTKGILHKIAIRTLYVPTGSENDLIVIADYNNGKEGWVLLDFIFKPTYFGNKSDNPLIIHTDKWEENRLTYNAKSLEPERDISTFWSGESLVINVHATEIVDMVRVKILGETDKTGNSYHKEITSYTENPAVSGGGIYKDELWKKDMIDKWGNRIPKQIDVQFEIVSGSGINTEILETLVYPITIDNRDPFFRKYKNY